MNTGTVIDLNTGHAAEDYLALRVTGLFVEHDQQVDRRGFGPDRQDVFDRACCGLVPRNLIKVEAHCCM
jgi:hypothetical protein